MELHEMEHFRLWDGYFALRSMQGDFLPDVLRDNWYHLNWGTIMDHNPYKSATWDLPDGIKIRLLTREAFECLPDGTKLHTILGRIVTKGEDRIDTDLRYGFLAVGTLVED